ncbi:MAG: tRNA lysidine(34) synthetase TilS [Flavobacterium sp.]|uniref:tRNA lysidine(34) synthetase TilS n=1 Tax=Flavobacterium sp. TaxID=239 RepID=UPI00120B1586|nr:tRNA lysidine(34) synthetase TilS [Flavobacterium sp.]RZJ65839.1 MAG: tRNA lysidine(34) synthetase TilS [Flavobacterium sp.]
MFEKFQSHLSKNLAFLSGTRLLLAVSGGLDSIAMATLFKKSGYDIAIAHCNFNLRGDESELDEIFIREFAAQNKVRFFSTKFDTQKFADDFKLSIQVAARELRYKWFYELLESQNFDFVLTAHHADDNLETFLINLSRGTGIDGLTGIPQSNEKIVRPMLPFSREEILAFAQNENLEWREDSSNSSDKYLRNKIRHYVLPQLKEINPELLNGFSKTQKYLQQTQSMANDAAILVYQKVARQDGNQIRFDLSELLKLPNFHAYLYHWLNGYGFSTWSDIYDLTSAQSGKRIETDDFVLLKDRGFLLLYPKRDEQADRSYSIYKGMSQVNFPLKLEITNVEKMDAKPNTAIFVDAKKLQFPLQLRRWREGDVIYPLGMEGKSKKVSKLFKDEKLSLPQKAGAWLLCSNDDIVWIVGLRQDERFKVTNNTTNILQIAVLE